MSEYRFDFSEHNTYGHVLRLVESSLGASGLIVDLGCGRGPLAEPLRDRGFSYAGIDVDEDNLSTLDARGIPAHKHDLTYTDGLSTLLKQLAEDAGEPIAAFLLLDVIEHLPDPEGFLRALRTASIESESGGAPLFVSVPNVTHFDIASALLNGDWTYTDEGLLDRTHLRFFSDRELKMTFSSTGWLQAAENDFELQRTEQAEYAGPLSGASEIADFLRHIRQVGDGRGAFTYQFVREFIPAAFEPPSSRVAREKQDVGLSIIVRTTGQRRDLIGEALLSLAAQQSQDFEVLVMVHSRDEGVVKSTRSQIGEFPPAFSRKVRVVPVIGGGRARPLNEGLMLAKGKYVAFLDDDDCVSSNWVSSFLDGASRSPGRIIRSVVADQEVERNADGSPYHLHSGPIVDPDRLRFDLVRHLGVNRTPICGFAVPMAAVRDLGLAFDESRAVLEDWEFLLRSASLCGVMDTGLVTSYYRRWNDHEASFNAVPHSLWVETKTAILAEFNSQHLLLPPGSVLSIRSILDELEALKGTVRIARKESTPADRREIARLLAELTAIKTSTSWRITKPIRWTLDSIKRMWRK